MRRPEWVLIEFIVIIMHACVVRAMKLETFTHADLMKLKSFVGRGLLPQLKQTLLSNTTQSLERHINHFIEPDIKEDSSSQNGLKLNLTNISSPFPTNQIRASPSNFTSNNSSSLRTQSKIAVNMPVIDDNSIVKDAN